MSETAKTALKWGGVVLAVALLAFGLHRYFEAVEEAERQDAVADSALQVALQDSTTADSALAVLDSVRAREAHVRDSLNAELREATEQAEAEHTSTVQAGENLHATLDSLARAVGPNLEPVVQRAKSQADSVLSAHDRFREQMRRQVRLLAQDTASLHRELAETRTALDSVAQSADSWRDAYREMESARDRWREAARLRLFGLPPELTHGVVGAGMFLLGTQL